MPAAPVTLSLQLFTTVLSGWTAGVNIVQNGFTRTLDLSHYGSTCSSDTWWGNTTRYQVGIQSTFDITFFQQDPTGAFYYSETGEESVSAGDFSVTYTLTWTPTPSPTSAPSSTSVAPPVITD